MSGETDQRAKTQGEPPMVATRPPCAHVWAHVWTWQEFATNSTTNGSAWRLVCVKCNCIRGENTR